MKDCVANVTGSSRDTLAVDFAQAPDGSSVQQMTITNGGCVVNILTWGATLQEFCVPGWPHSLVLGSSDFEPYLSKMKYFGSIVGPVANRISNGEFRIGDQVYKLQQNENAITTLHGGENGVAHKNWSLTGLTSESCTLQLQCPDGEGGFPGNRVITVTYALENDGALRMEIYAETDAPTFINLANHSFWNLDGSKDIAQHQIKISASSYLPVDDCLIPTGEVIHVEKTYYDFRRFRHPSIPDDILDHNFCLDLNANELRHACTLRAGRLELVVETTEPGLQVHDGAAIDSGPFVGHQGTAYGSRAGIVLEPQRWPDAPNKPHFPSAELLPGESYHQTSRFRATIRSE